MTTPSTDRKVTVLPDGLKPGDVRVSTWEGRAGWYHVEIARASKVKQAYYSLAEFQNLLRAAMDAGVQPAAATAKPRAPRKPRATAGS